MLPLVLSLPALTVFGLWGCHELAPATEARILSSLDAVVGAGLRLGLFVLVPALAALLALWPPALPLLRLAGARVSRRLSFDRRATARVMERLEHFPTAKDLCALGRLYLDAGQPRMALAPLAQAVEQAPRDARAQLLLGQCALDLGKRDEALAAVERAVALDARVSFGAGKLLLAELRLGSGRAEDALEIARGQRRENGPSIRGWLVEARALRRLGRRDEMRKALEELCAHAPGEGKRYTPEEAFARARARVGLRGGRP